MKSHESPQKYFIISSISSISSFLAVTFCPFNTHSIPIWLLKNAPWPRFFHGGPGPQLGADDLGSAKLAAKAAFCLSWRLHGGWPSGKHTENYGKSPCLMGKLTISLVIFNSYFDITRGYMGKSLRNHGDLMIWWEWWEGSSPRFTMHGDWNDTGQWG